MKASKDNIRAAICKNRGGLKNATDDQLATLWGSLPDELQKQYLESVKAAPGKSTGPDK